MAAHVGWPASPIVGWLLAGCSRAGREVRKVVNLQLVRSLPKKFGRDFHFVSGFSQGVEEAQASHRAWVRSTGLERPGCKGTGLVGLLSAAGVSWRIEALPAPVYWLLLRGAQLQLRPESRKCAPPSNQRSTSQHHHITTALLNRKPIVEQWISPNLSSQRGRRPSFMATMAHTVPSYRASYSTAAGN